MCNAKAHLSNSLWLPTLDQNGKWRRQKLPWKVHFSLCCVCVYLCCILWQWSGFLLVFAVGWRHRLSGKSQPWSSAMATLTLSSYMKFTTTRYGYLSHHKFCFAGLSVDPVETAALLSPGTGTRQINGKAWSAQGLCLSLHVLSHEHPSVCLIFHTKCILNCSCTNIHFVPLNRNNLDLLVLLIEPHTQTKLSVHVLQLKFTSVIGKVCPCGWLCTGSLASVLQAQEHHFSPDELSVVITVPQRPVTQIKAALPRLSSTEFCLCSWDPALMRNSTLLPKHIIPFPLCLASFTFTQCHYGLIFPAWDQGWAAFAIFIMQQQQKKSHPPFQHSAVFHFKLWKPDLLYITAKPIFCDTLWNSIVGANIAVG